MKGKIKLAITPFGKFIGKFDSEKKTMVEAYNLLKLYHQRNRLLDCNMLAR